MAGGEQDSHIRLHGLHIRTVVFVCLAVILLSLTLLLLCTERFLHSFLHLQILGLVPQGRGSGAPEFLQQIRREVWATDRVLCQLCLFLVLSLSVVEVVEVRDNDGHRQSDGQDTRNGAQGPHDLAPHSDGLHVPITHSRHGHHSPPERIWDALEMGGGFIRLREIHSAGEQDDPDEKEEDQKAQLPHAGSEGVAQDLQALGVSGKLEDPEHADQSDDPEDGKGHGLLLLTIATPLLLGQIGAQGDEIRQNGDNVNDVHDVFEEEGLAGTSKATNHKLEGKPNNTDRLHDEEGVVEYRVPRVLRVGCRGVIQGPTVPARAQGHDEIPVVPELRQSLQAENDDGD